MNEKTKKIYSSEVQKQKLLKNKSGSNKQNTETL